MIASLPMYTHQRLEAEHRRYWQLIHAALKNSGMDSPAELTPGGKRYEIWKDPDLVLSQTCGMPYRNDLHGVVTLVGTPDFGLADCRPGFYRSVIVVRRDDPRHDMEAFRDATFAFNGEDSQSGFAAPFAHAKALGFWFENRIKSGVHLRSAQFVAEGRADIAALDAVTWRLVERYEACASSLRVLETTAQTPGLPYITALNRDGGMIFDAVARAIAGLSEPDRGALGLKGIIRIPAKDYLAVPNPD